MGTEPASDPAVICLVRDLLLASRITTPAAAMNVPLRVLRSSVDLDRTSAGRLLLVDLNQDGAIDAAARWHGRTTGAVVGFLSHVDAATAARARSAGLTRVLARSAFVGQVAELLKNVS